MTLIGLLADLAAHDPIQFAERMLVNAKLAAARGDGRTAARHTATAMVAAQKALEAENQPRKAREIIGDARRLATLLKFQLATQTGLAPQRQPLAAAEIHFTEALRKLDELKLDEALERLKNAHTAAIQSQIDAELNQDPYTQRQAQVMAENIQTYATAIRSSVDNPLALITMLTAMKAQGMSGLGSDFLLPTKKTQLPQFIKEHGTLPSAMQSLKQAAEQLRQGQFLLAALNAHYATIKAGVAYKTNPKLADRILRTTRRLIAMAVLGRTEVIPEQTLIRAQTGRSLNPVDPLNGFLGANFEQLMLARQTWNRLPRHQRISAISKIPFGREGIWTSPMDIVDADWEELERRTQNVIADEIARGGGQ